MSRSQQPELLRMESVSKRFGATVVLDGVNLSVHSGQVHALVGENGAGKSTLIKILSGALSADSGQLHIDGQPFQPRNPLEARRAGIAMIYQEPSLAGYLTVAENILLGMDQHRWGIINRKHSRQKAEEALSYFQHPEIHPDTVVNQLSVAAAQLVEIARALAMRCRILVLDEPTSSLTQSDVKHLYKLIAQLKERAWAQSCSALVLRVFDNLHRELFLHNKRKSQVKIKLALWFALCSNSVHERKASENQGKSASGLQVFQSDLYDA